jgi:hypothetical protein
MRDTDLRTNLAGAAATITPPENRGRRHFFLFPGLLVIGCLTALSVYSYRVNREPEAGLEGYLRGAISCCTAHQLERFFDSRSLAALSQMFRNPVDEPYWENAVLAVGVLAPYSDELAKRLLEFVYTPDVFDAWEWSANRVPVRPARVRDLREVDISEGLVAAKMHGLVACGNLLGRARGKIQAPGPLEALIAGTEPDFWQQRILWKSSPHFASDDERNTALAGEAVKALAASHLPSAQLRLAYMRDVVRPREPLLRESLEQALCGQSSSCGAGR